MMRSKESKGPHRRSLMPWEEVFVGRAYAGRRGHVHGTCQAWLLPGERWSNISEPRSTECVKMKCQLHGEDGWQQAKMIQFIIGTLGGTEPRSTRGFCCLFSSRSSFRFIQNVMIACLFQSQLKSFGFMPANLNIPLNVPSGRCLGSTSFRSCLPVFLKFKQFLPGFEIIPAHAQSSQPQRPSWNPLSGHVHHTHAGPVFCGTVSCHSLTLQFVLLLDL